MAGLVSLGFGPAGKRVRRKVSGRTKTEVKDKLQDLHDELRAGIRSSPTYTVQDAVDDWLTHGLAGPVGEDNLHEPRGTASPDCAHRSCEA